MRTENADFTNVRLRRQLSARCLLRRTSAIAALFLLASPCFLGQSVALSSDQKALTLSSATIRSMLGKQAVTDVTFTGNVTSGPDSSEDGSVTLRALGTTESRIELNLPEGTRTEIRGVADAIPSGEWINQDGSTGIFAAHNLLTDPVWFFPALGSLAGGTNVVLSYIGDETFEGHNVFHLRSIQTGLSWPSTSAISQQELSAVDFYIDSATLLPVATVFNEHPDNNSQVNIAVEVDFSDYQVASGIEVPMHIRRLVNGSPVMDITLTDVQFNTGLTAAEFSTN